MWSSCLSWMIAAVTAGISAPGLSSESVLGPPCSAVAAAWYHGRPPGSNASSCTAFRVLCCTADVLSCARASVFGSANFSFALPGALEGFSGSLPPADRASASSSLAALPSCLPLLFQLATCGLSILRANTCAQVGCPSRLPHAIEPRPLIELRSPKSGS